MPVSPAVSRASAGWTEARIAAPTTGPAAMPRKVSAPTTPSARGRAGPPNRCAAAAVPTGTRTPPPTAWTSRAAMSWSSVCAAPASAEPTVKTTSAPMNKPAGAPQVGQPAGHRHRQDVDQQIAVDDPAGLAQLDPGGATGGIGKVGQDRRQRDRGDQQFHPGQEDAEPDDGEQDQPGASGHVRECIEVCRRQRSAQAPLRVAGLFIMGLTVTLGS